MSATEMISSAKEIMASVSGLTVKDYKTNGDLTVTEFSDGTKVYANYANTDVLTTDGTVKAENYLLVRGE